MPETATLEQPVQPVAPSTPAPEGQGAPQTPAASTETTSERPKSFLKAFEKLDAAANADTPTAKPTVPGTIAQPVTSSSPTPKPTASVPGPSLADHTRILENARAQTRAEVMAEVDRDYGWMRVGQDGRPIPRDSWIAAAEYAKKVAQDPLAYYQELGETLAAHPVYGQYFQQPSTNGGAASGDDMPQPDVQILDGQGRVVGMTYSDQALAQRDRAIEARILAQVRGELAPVRQDLQSREEAARAAEIAAANGQEADRIMARINKILDGRTDLHAHVDAIMAADPNIDAHDAALQVRAQFITPSVQDSATQTAADVMRRKAAANTSTGQGPVARPATRPRNEKELAAFMADLDARA